jgi:membrane protein required for colicin V production
MGALSFHYVDLLVIGIVVASAAFATLRGFVAETLSIFAWAAAAFATLYFAPSATPLLAGVMSPIFAQLGAYIFVFLVVLIPLSFASARFSEGVRSSAIGPLDRSLGAVFGVVRGLILLAMCYLLLCLMQPPDKQGPWITQAWTLPVVQDTADVLLSLVPERDSIIFAQGSAASETKRAAPNRSSAPAAQPKSKPGSRKAAKSHAKKSEKTYGARQRRELDRLIQATDGDEKKP